MNILFMGTPDIATGCLERIIKEGYNVCAVVTQPDKQKGRGHKMMPTSVKSFALEHNIDVYQPDVIKNGELLPVLNEYKPDVIIVVAYGKILPKYVLDFPKYGCINMHASKLPKYRGAAPIQWAIINGETQTAATAMLMDEGLDTGPILLEETISIGDSETSGELFEKMTVAGGNVIVKVLENIDNLTPVAQKGDSSYASVITKEMAHINWNENAGKICKLICGMNPSPLAYTDYKDERVKIVSAKAQDNVKGEIGQIIKVSKEGILVKAKDSSVLITSLRFPGKKTMSVADYIKGNNIEEGTILL